MKQIYNLLTLSIFINFSITTMYCQNNLAITNATTMQDQYSMIPLSQLSVMATGATIDNIGTAESTNVVLTVSVMDSSSSIVYTESSSPQTMQNGASVPIIFTGYTPTVLDTYTTTYTLTLAETDDDTSDNETSSILEVTTNTYARDDNTFTISLGVAQGNSAQLGQQYDIINQQDIFSVDFFLNNSSGLLNGTTTFVTVWDMVSNIPNSIVAQTEIVTITDNVDQMYTANIIGGSYTLTPGKYVVVVNQDATQNNISLAGANNIFTPQTVWASLNGGAWDYLENFGFSNTLVIRPNLQDSTLSTQENQFSNNTIAIYPNPSSEFITIYGINKKENYSIYNILGAKIKNGTVSNNAKINIRNFTNGLYFLKFDNGNTIKFIKE